SLDAWATLAGLAPLTTRLRLGTMVSPATFRHPSVLARMATTVDHVSGGRVEVGLGAGWYEREHVENGFPFLDASARFQLFAEQVEVLVRTWTEQAFDHRGAHYQLRRQTALPRPLQRPHPPLVLGGRAGRRAAALAARFASEYNTLGAPLEQLRERRRRLDEACAAAGRDPATLGCSLMVTTVVADDRATLAERLRRVRELTGREPPPHWLVGTVEELAERLAELGAVGISRVLLQHLDHRDLDAVAAMGRLARA
ncbi:MAG TPA: LLM class flavin-dependent oxidoreductase, partial [Gaiellaceae bacterium]|nr:LLM class flavin-dependent oxidoreductase [Gaiellaceae bacterium]